MKVLKKKKNIFNVKKNTQERLVLIKKYDGIFKVAEKDLAKKIDEFKIANVLSYEK